MSRLVPPFRALVAGFGVTVLLGAGCRLPSATLGLHDEVEAQGGAPGPVVFAERDLEPEMIAPEGPRDDCVPEARRPADPSDPTTIPCPADIADSASLYFGGRVTLRLPVGLTEDNFVEYSSSFARSTREVESVSCTDGMPGAMIAFAALAVVDEDPAKAPSETRDELLEGMGYEDVRVCGGEFDPDFGVLDSVFSVPGAPDHPEPAAVIARLVVRGEQRAMIVYEVHPFAWIVIRQTLAESAQSLSLLSPP